MDQQTKGAIRQRDKVTWAVKPRTPLGLLSPGELLHIAQVAERHGVTDIKMTSGQRFILLGIPEEKLAALRADLGPLGELCRNYVQACPGIQHCEFAAQDSLGLGRRLEAMLFGQEYPAKVKVGVSACPFCCAESQVRDIGLVGRSRGWWVYVGGNSGTKPRVAELLAKDLSDEAALDLVARFLEFYRTTCKGKVRTARFLQQAAVGGMEGLRRALGLEQE